MFQQEKVLCGVASQILTTRKQNHEASSHGVHLVLLHLQRYVPFSFLSNFDTCSCFCDAQLLQWAMWNSSSLHSSTALASSSGVLRL